MHFMNSTLYPDVEGINETAYEKFMKDHFPKNNFTGQDIFKSCSLEEELNSAAAGTGLAFVVFTQAIVELPASPFWSIIFFLMLLALGLGSQIGTMEGVVNTVFESPMFSHIRKEILTGQYSQWATLTFRNACMYTLIRCEMRMVMKMRRMSFTNLS